MTIDVGLRRVEPERILSEFPDPEASFCRAADHDGNIRLALGQRDRTGNRNQLQPQARMALPQFSEPRGEKGAAEPVGRTGQSSRSRHSGQASATRDEADLCRCGYCWRSIHLQLLCQSS